MRGVKFKLESSGRQGLALSLGVVCLMGLSARAQVADSSPKKTPTTRLLTVKEGRSIVNVALEEEQPPLGTQDCSHLTHQIYASAGFDYSYASSFELFVGHKDFVRVNHPRAGDLIVWPGHVGIVVNPSQHSFSSLGSTGLGVRDYHSAYWKSRGQPRFYRYKVQDRAAVETAKAHAPTQISNHSGQPSEVAAIERRPADQNSTMNAQLKETSEQTALIYGPMPPVGPMPPAEPTEAGAALEVPETIIVTEGSKAPTREEVAEGISELNDAAGNALQSDDLFKLRQPLVIVERFTVERVEIKGGHGWAHVRIDSKVSIVNGAAQQKQVRENVRVLLRRVASGWEAVNPTDRTYVPHDLAVKSLAARLAQLTESEGAAAHEQGVLRQESQIANLLNTLLETK